MNQDQAALADSLRAELARQQRPPAAGPAELSAAATLARRALGAGLAAEAIPLLAALGQGAPGNAEIALLHGVALRLEQRLVEALQVFTAAIAAAPGDAALRQGLAQTRFELGLPAAALFADLAQAQPDALELLRLRAAALAAEGEPGAAETLLEAALAKEPGWAAGHKALSVLRWTRGDPARFAASYEPALKAQPANAELWLAWFRALAQTRDWPATLAVIDRAEAQLGTTPALLVARLFVASEAGDANGTARLLAAAQGIRGETIDLIRVRQFLRERRPREAEAIALAQVRTPSASLFWPYLSLVWRLAGDPRHLWLDNPDRFIRLWPVALGAAELAELAEVLRGLHGMARPYAEQSVRGGTQTDRSVILRHEEPIRRARAAWLEAIGGFVATLPPHEPGHPLLGLPRTELLVEGSWSVRLLAQGHNVAHNHPVGWLSTAFYIALPAPEQMGPPPAGHIAFGTPPAELGLDLPAYCTIAPAEGVTAIFPSTMWHRTMPFADGERLVMALDVRRPRR